MKTEQLDSPAVAGELAPEEVELARKRDALAPLEEELAQRELEAATLKAELRDFEALYVNLVGKLYVTLDRVEAEIAEEEARLFPDDEEAHRRAAEARRRAEESAEAADAVSWQGCNRKFNPPPALKKMYRSLARLIHPDLTADACESERRHHVMARVNRAYEDGDETTIASLLDEWRASPELVKGDDIGAELVRVIRQIAQAERRLAALAREMEELKSSELYSLRLKVEEEERAGRDHLARMAERAETQIKRARQRLAHLHEAA